MATIGVRQRGAIRDCVGGQGRSADAQIGYIRGHAHTHVDHVQRIVDDFRSGTSHKSREVGQCGPIADHLVFRLQIHWGTRNTGQAIKGAPLVLHCVYILA